MRFDARQFCHLMASCFTLCRSAPAVAGESVFAVTAAGGKHRDEIINAARGASPRQCPRWPGCHPAYAGSCFSCCRAAVARPASPSEDGGFEEVTEFCRRSPSFRSRSATCFSASAICFSASRSRCSFSRSCSRSISLSRLRRSFSRSSFRHSGVGGFAGDGERCRRFEALKHLHCQVLHQRSRPELNIFGDFVVDHLNCYPLKLYVANPGNRGALKLAVTVELSSRVPTKLTGAPPP